MTTQAELAQSRVDAAFAFAVTQEQFGIGEIQIKMGMSYGWAKGVIRAWRKAGLLEEVPWVQKDRALWRVRHGAKALQPRAIRTPEANMWTAMRQMKGGFTPRDLAVHATTEETAVTPDVAQDYCRALLGAGYLGVTRKAVPGRAEAIYRLARNTGPHAPREKRVRAVVDPNTEEVIVIGGGQ